MADMMTFPNTWEEYEQFYGITDTEEIYTNGARLIPSFRVRQWLDHIAQTERKKGEWIDRNGNIVSPFWERYECSECGARSDNTNYCPNCGRKMKGKGGEK